MLLRGQVKLYVLAIVFDGELELGWFLVVAFLLVALFIFNVFRFVRILACGFLGGRLVAFIPSE